MIYLFCQQSCDNQIKTCLDFRDMWEALCVLKLFMEHVCQPAGDGEEMIAPLALTLWMVGLILT